jgi:hypothetical protein
MLNIWYQFIHYQWNGYGVKPGVQWNHYHQQRLLIFVTIPIPKHQNWKLLNNYYLVCHASSSLLLLLIRRPTYVMFELEWPGLDNEARSLDPIFASRYSTLSSVRSGWY